MALSDAGQLLLLWDIDGTLLQRASVEHGQAVRHALAEVHGIKDVDAPYVQIAGRTDGAIARDLLLAAGVPEADIDAGASDVRAAACRAYENLCPPDLSHTVAPGIATLLAELADAPEHFRLSLLTGNFEGVARLKLERAGIGDFFPRGQGAFGSDAEAREALPAVARERAGEFNGGSPWPRERTLIIGDTPRDVLAARADKLRCIAVATGPFDAAALREADFVAQDGHEIASVLRKLSSSPAPDAGQ
ncbi:MAG: haloacid dehalogenase-like hydrolase [Actinomycetota bacterium]|nr:haloacid dehalogenase-like hydrolase [Actinomycetota bacterium]